MRHQIGRVRLGALNLFEFVTNEDLTIVGVLAPEIAKLEKPLTIEL